MGKEATKREATTREATTREPDFLFSRTASLIFQVLPICPATFCLCQNREKQKFSQLHKGSSLSCSCFPKAHKFGDIDMKVVIRIVSDESLLWTLASNSGESPKDLQRISGKPLRNATGIAMALIIRENRSSFRAKGWRKKERKDCKIWWEELVDSVHWSQPEIV